VLVEDRVHSVPGTSSPVRNRLSLQRVMFSLLLESGRNPSNGVVRAKF
jgi:hypothetical protein